MHVETLGTGRPKHTVLTCVHGDETCGWHAVNRLRAHDVALNAPLKFVLANERAFKLGYRYCDVDLNRVMPGDSESDQHEERLAARLDRELQGTKVLDIHSTESSGCPYAIVTGGDDASFQLARSTGLDRIVDMSYMPGGVTKDIPGVAVECGYHDDRDAAAEATRVLLNFLAAQGLLDREPTHSNPTVYQVVGEERGRGFRFLGENFRRVRRGEVFAERKDAVRRAEEAFYPVLMSTHGYEHRIGFRARKRTD